MEILKNLELCRMWSSPASYVVLYPRPSPVLLASGVERCAAANALRVSVGRETTTEDIELFISDLLHARETILSDHVTPHTNWPIRLLYLCRSKLTNQIAVLVWLKTDQLGRCSHVTLVIKTLCTQQNWQY